MSYIPHPLRVPHEAGARYGWLYFRTWSIEDGYAERTCGYHLACCDARTSVLVPNIQPLFGVVRVCGVPYREWLERIPLEERMAEVDAYLLACGGEVVPPEEWPRRGFGGTSEKPLFELGKVTREDTELWASYERFWKTEVASNEARLQAFQEGGSYRHT